MATSNWPNSSISSGSTRAARSSAASSNSGSVTTPPMNPTCSPAPRVFPNASSTTVCTRWRRSTHSSTCDINSHATTDNPSLG
ncbi:hypothetical protein ACN28S_62995 [Cystobacter fuscus]